jgi:hypothetical protein
MHVPTKKMMTWIAGPKGEGLRLADAGIVVKVELMEVEVELERRSPLIGDMAAVDGNFCRVARGTL